MFALCRRAPQSQGRLGQWLQAFKRGGFAGLVDECAYFIIVGPHVDLTNPLVSFAKREVPMFGAFNASANWAVL